MVTRTVQLFITPTPGLRLNARVDALRRALEGEGMRVIVTRSGFDPPAIDRSADHVCAVGGDGTLRYVVDATRALDRPIDVSVYPAGTVNLVAMEYAYARAPGAFATRVARNVPTKHHLASVNQVPLLCCASIGPDSYAVKAVSPRLKRWFGRLAYVLAFLTILVRWPRTTLILQHDGATIACEAVYIVKGRYYAGRWSIVPEARGSEPSLHVVALPTASRLDFLRFAWAIARRRVQDLPGVHRFTCDMLTIDGDPAIPVQSDGDVLTHLPATARIEPDFVRFA